MNSEDNQLFLLIDKELYKKASQYVSSLQKRYPSATYYKILDQYVKFRQSPGKYSFENGLKPLLDAKSPPNDPKSLGMSHRFLLELGYDTTKALEPYEKAMMKYSNSETCYDWFVESLNDLNWRHLSKSSFQMPRINEKAKARLFQFWNSLATVIWFQLDKENISERVLDMLPRLTYKLTKDLQPFQDEQELFVFCRVCELFNDKSQEIVDEILKFWKEGSYLDLYLKNFLMDHLSQLGASELVWKCGIRLLDHLDDYEILVKIIEAAHKLEKPFYELYAVLTKKDSRNYMLARVKASQLYKEKFDETLTAFVKRYHDKPSCPTDLKSLDLDLSFVREVFDQLPDGLVHDKAKSELFRTNDNLEQFIRHRESLQTKPKTDYSDCSYFILEIVKDLVDDDNITLENVVTCVSLLEGYQQQDPFNYDTRVWLVLLYTYIGLPQEAYRHFQHLKIKNVQNDLVNHWLFTRFSTALPNKNYEFCQSILQPQPIYNSLKNMSGFIVAAFERKSWSKLPGIIAFYERVTRSYTRWNLTVETLQMSRILNEKKLDQFKTINQDLNAFGLHNFTEGNWFDNRDFQIFDKDVARFSKLMAPINVDKEWLKISISRELVFYSLARNERNRFVEATIQADIHGRASTRMELWAWQIAQLLYQSIAQENVDYTRLSKLIQECPDTVPDTWELSHSYLLKIGTLKTLDQLKRIKDVSVKRLVKDALKHARDSCLPSYQSYAQQIQHYTINDQLSVLAYPNKATEVATEINQISRALRNI